MAPNSKDAAEAKDLLPTVGGCSQVCISNGACTMGKGTIDHPDVTFNCTGADWVQLSNGTLGGFQAFFTGRLKITGNQFNAHRLDELFP